MELPTKFRGFGAFFPIYFPRKTDKKTKFCKFLGGRIRVEMPTKFRGFGAFLTVCKLGVHYKKARLRKIPLFW